MKVKVTLEWIVEVEGARSFARAEEVVWEYFDQRHDLGDYVAVAEADLEPAMLTLNLSGSVVG